MSRVGLGFDAHAFEADRPLILGGVTIPDAPGLAGHSDADVVSHAIADALLGSTGLGDLGELFPDDDRWKGASSLEILRLTAQKVTQAGWTIENVDVTIVAQRPRLASFRSGMVEKIAGSLGAAPTDVSVKATTTDGMGSIGRAEGIAALAVVLVNRL
ncbi:MAG: 2-C-methyl-D-erythritol 2,4-cyclodiphosphate synthase [Actinomycetota bacterium]|nr:2-C-methyl-D-erythritol 2,4-cyclodiphosphate synthase [Actinomycetota bacterium]